MSAHDQMRAMLDQLMGTARNGDDTRFRVKFSDARVCKSFLLNCCPHEILSATRMDLGECYKIHDLALRADYEQASHTKDYFYDIDAMEHLQSFITDCDRRTEAAKKRLAETQEELSAEVAAKMNKVHDLAEQIGKKLAKAEALGADGLVEESMKLMEEVEDLRKTKAAAEHEYRNSMPASSYQQQKLRVCEVCSAYLGIHDNDRRLADHFGGKLHLGFIKIREKLEDLKKTVEARKEKRREEWEMERASRYEEGDEFNFSREGTRERERYNNREERNHHHHHHHEQHRDRNRERDNRERERERDNRERENRERMRERDRDRERDRHSRDRYREREERDRRHRRSRSRSKSRDRRHRRSRSKERYRRSHSRRSRTRSRSRDRRRDHNRRSRSRRSRSRDRHTKSRDRSQPKENSNSNSKVVQEFEEKKTLPDVPEEGEVEDKRDDSLEQGEIRDDVAGQ